MSPSATGSGPFERVCFWQNHMEPLEAYGMQTEPAYAACSPSAPVLEAYEQQTSGPATNTSDQGGGQSSANCDTPESGLSCGVPEPPGPPPGLQQNAVGTDLASSALRLHQLTPGVMILQRRVQLQIAAACCILNCNTFAGPCAHVCAHNWPKGFCA